MNPRIDVHVVRVFTDKNGAYGSPVSIIVDEAKRISPEKRQEITRQIGFSETVFINKLHLAEVSIYALQNEIPFAGSASIGAAWYISKLQGKQVETIICQDNTIKIQFEEGLTWVMVEDLSILPNWNLVKLASASKVEELSVSEKPFKEHSYAWAWIDESYEIGRIRARTFAPDWDIPEEQANGSGSMLLAHKLGRSIAIVHGNGSCIRAIAGSTGVVAVGGLVTEDPSMRI
jgi:predicted PhzF superfamily epimerase YddE/YHI9